jgi:carboxylesterase
MIISPAFAVPIIPIGLTPAAVACILAVPNFFKWWDPELKDAPAPPLNNYPWLSSHALAQVMRLGQLVQSAARHAPPAAGKVVMVLNENDASVDNRAAEVLAANWQKQGAREVTTYTFERSYELDHDLISQDHPKQKVDIVHPVLVQLMNGRSGLG